MASAVYTLPPQAATPTFSLPAGTYTSKQTVTISDSTTGATIYYSTNGSIPTTSSSVYHGPISIVDPTTTLQAIATASVPLASAPTFSVDSGTYATPQTVSITDSTPGAIIQYQTGTFPTASSPIYSGPITVSSSEYIYATATASGYLPSEMSNAFYEINPLAEQTAAPSFSVPAGTYTTPQTVAIADTTAGAYVYYTTDGSTPTARSTVYGTPITVSSTQTLKAIVRAGGDTVSAVTSAVYTISPPTPSFSITGTAIRMARGATSGNTSTITLTPTGGFTGAIRLSCAISPRAANDPATCSIPTSATISGAAAQTTLTVNTTAVASISNPSGSLFGPFVSGTLSCILLAGMPARRRRWQSILGIVALLFSIGLSSCGGAGNVGGSGGGGNTGTTPGLYDITVTGTSGSVTQTGTVSLTVQTQ